MTEEKKEQIDKTTALYHKRITVKHLNVMGVNQLTIQRLLSRWCEDCQLVAVDAKCDFCGDSNPEYKGRKFDTDTAVFVVCMSCCASATEFFGEEGVYLGKELQCVCRLIGR